ncbi:MAG: lipopolysaccharide biosynthesis protein, partial [Rubrobacter sp.]|nr:lipopolysaccharide biosynthesis protein [Rubrobacter sp.]
MARGGDRGGLAGATFTAFKWNYVGTLVRAFSQLAIGIVLARLLGPEPFGLVAVGWLVLGLGNLIADFGFGAALVQRREISDADIRFVFTVQVLLGLGLTVLVASSAGLIARVFNDPDVVPVMQALSLVFVLQAFGQTAASLLRRGLDFRGLQTSQVSSYLFGFLLLGIPLAYAGFGVWSLVIAQLVQSLLFASFLYLRVRHPVRPLLAGRAGFFDFGAKVMGTNLLNQSILNIDTFFVGRYFGTFDLGLYNRAYTLMFTSMTSLTSALQAVLFSSYSKLQDRTEALRKVYLASSGMVVLVTAPVFGGAAIVSGTVIEGLYGARWLEAAPLLVPLALSMVFHAAMTPAGPLLTGMGRVERELYVQVFGIALLVPVMYFTSGISLVALAWGVFAVYVVRALALISVALRSVGSGWWEMLVAARGGVLVLCGVAPVLLAVDSFLASLGVSAALRLLAEV